MSVAEPTMMPARSAAPAASFAQAGLRDPRLDFFRGIAMFIILMAHTPGNWLTLWIPARFGFSDATEIFVFCSGMASAIAFGRVFREQGIAMGSARVGFRVWQVYWAHIGLFVAVAATMVVLNQLFPDGRNYVNQLNLKPFFDNPQDNLVGLLTLTYVPNYFDILPMYMVILALMPVMFFLARIHVLLMVAASVGIWLVANVGGVDLPAEPWSDRGWFFNPLGWQLVFFTGFAFMAGWFPAPPVNKWLFAIAVAIILINIPLSNIGVRAINREWLEPLFGLTFEGNPVIEWRLAHRPWFTKSDFGILRYTHFLALAYVAWVLVGPRGDNIQPRGDGVLTQIWTVILAAIMKVGQQSLAVFIGSMYLARWLGVMFDQVGKTHFSMLYVNAFGFLLIILLAYGAGWFKSQPWKKKKAA